MAVFSGNPQKDEICDFTEWLALLLDLAFQEHEAGDVGRCWIEMLSLS